MIVGSDLHAEAPRHREGVASRSAAIEGRRDEEPGLSAAPVRRLQFLAEQPHAALMREGDAEH